jgi:uncharacterized protein
VSAPDHSPQREGTLPQSRVRWGILDSTVGLIFAAALIGGEYILSRAPWLPHSEGISVGIQVLFYVLILVFVILTAKRRGLGSLRRDFGFELHWIDLLIGVGLAVALQISNALVYLFAVNVLHLPVAPTGNITLPKTRWLAVLDGLAVASFFAPIVEELFFRGLLMRSIRNLVIRRAKPEGPRTTRRAARISIVVSALVFAAAHLYESRNLTMLFVLGISIFIFGLVSAAIATRTGRLGPSMMIHMLTNGFGIVVLLSTTN